MLGIGQSGQASKVEGYHCNSGTEAGQTSANIIIICRTMGTIGKLVGGRHRQSGGYCLIVDGGLDGDLLL